MSAATSQPEAGIRIQVLGGFRVRVDGRPIDDVAWQRRRAARLVKRLALAPGHRLPREQLVETLWPESEPEGARNRLDQTVHLARRLLVPDAGHDRAGAYLAQRAEQVVLAPGVPLWVDLDAFEAAAAAAHGSDDVASYRTALAHYPGDLLPDDPYLEWVIDRRTQLHQAHVRLLTELAGVHQGRGELAEAVTVLQDLVGIEPADEAVQSTLMRLYLQLGQRTLALRQYHALVEALKRDLDAEPGPDVQRLHQAILQGGTETQRPAPGGAGTGGRPPPARPATTGPTRPVRRHNLPAPLTSFVGREREQAEVADLVRRARLVTLTGAGGTGKTRLALQVAAGQLAAPDAGSGQAFQDGVWYVELAPLADPQLVPRALGAVVGVREEPGQPLLATLAEVLRQRRLLVLLDNCEHLIEACARTADTLLRACPRLHLLATSREALGIDGEHAYRIPSLEVPPADSWRTDPTDPADAGARAATRLLDYAAVRLFVDRALAANPHFRLTDQNAAAAAQICGRLDGIPLAIELAAARLRTMSVEQVNARLDDRFWLLTGGSRAALPRHQTLRALIEWGYLLLAEDERALLRRLSVFAGGWTLAAAEAVAAGEPLDALDVLERLTALVDKSLVLIEPGEGGSAGEPRYRCLETVRQYAAERLLEAGEAPAFRSRHLGYYLQLAELANTGASARNFWQSDPARIRQILPEHDNLRWALEWSRTEPLTGLRLAVALGDFWFSQSHWPEGRDWLDELLALAPEAPPSPRADALFRAGQLRFALGELKAGLERLVESRTIFRRLHDNEGIACTLIAEAVHHANHGDAETAISRLHEALQLIAEAEAGDLRRHAVQALGMVLVLDGRAADALPYLEEVLLQHERAGDERRLATTQHHLADACAALGDLDRAERLYQQSLAQFRRTGWTYAMLLSHRGLGDIALARGDLPGSLRWYREALEQRLRLGNRLGVPVQLICFAGVATAAGQARLAVRLLGAADSLCERFALGLNRWAAGWAEACLAAAGERLDPATVDALREAGRRLSLEEAVALARSVRVEA